MKIVIKSHYITDFYNQEISNLKDFKLFQAAAEILLVSFFFFIYE